MRNSPQTGSSSSAAAIIFSTSFGDGISLSAGRGRLALTTSQGFLEISPWLTASWNAWRRMAWRRLALVGVRLS